MCKMCNELFQEGYSISACRRMHDLERNRTVSEGLQQRNRRTGLRQRRQRLQVYIKSHDHK